MNRMHNMADLETFLNAQEDPSVRVPVLCEVTYDGEYVIPYATMSGYHVSKSSEKMAAYGYVLENIPKSEKEEFAYATFAMIPGQTSRFTVMLCADDLISPAGSDNDTLTYFEIGIPGFDVNFEWAHEGAVDILIGDDAVEDVYAYLADVAAVISADAPAVSDDVITVVVSKDFTLSKPSAVYWRINGVRLRGSVSSDYALEISINRVHSVDLAGMETSFDENVDIAAIYAKFTPEIEPDNEVVVKVSSIPYATKKGVYEVYVHTSTGKVSTGEGEDDAQETWTDEAVLVFDVSSGESTTESYSSSSSSGGCNSGLGLTGVLALLVIKRKR